MQENLKKKHQRNVLKKESNVITLMLSCLWQNHWRKVVKIKLSLSFFLFICILNISTWLSLWLLGFNITFNNISLN
jgi:hypothetical protein